MTDLRRELIAPYSATPLSWFAFITIPPGLSYIPVNVLANPLGLATNRGDAAFAAAVDAALGEVIADGTWLSHFEEWIGGPPPWTVDQMASVPPA